jgi:hypothetical protein
MKHLSKKAIIPSRDIRSLSSLVLGLLKTITPSLTRPQHPDGEIFGTERPADGRSIPEQSQQAEDNQDNDGPAR